MRIKELTIYSQYFRFLLEDNKAITGSEPYSPVIAAVTYDNERQTVVCTCSSNPSCEHKVTIHEVIEKETDSTLGRYLNDCREPSAQTITTETINRLRGTFAREYNIAKGVVQTPERRQPLGWQGSIPGSSNRMRVVQVPQRSLETFAVFENGEDTWRTVVGIDNPECNGGVCRTGCEHEKAVEIAIRVWRRQGLFPSGFSGKSADTVIMDDFTMVERAEPVSRTGTITGGWLTVPTGSVYRNIVPTAQEESWLESFLKEVENTATSGYTIGIDPAKIEEDINKAKKLLEKKEKPKPEKPAKPRTRFTDLEL